MNWKSIILKEDIAKIQEQRNEIHAKWLERKQKSEDLPAIKKKLIWKLEAERASRVGDYAKKLQNTIRKT